MSWGSLLLVAATAAMPSQFDLNCTHGNGNPGVILRINLEAGEWCNVRIGCTKIEKIESATSGLLVLKDKKPQFRGDYLEYQEVNRITGEYRSIYEGSISNDATQDCVRAPFSGVSTPIPKF